MKERGNEIERLLAQMEKIGASDLHLKVGSPPIFRVHGTPQRVKGDPMTMDQVRLALDGILDAEKRKTLAERGSVDFALGVSGVGRFRVNIFMQRGAPSFAARRVNTRIPTLEELLLPEAIAEIAAYGEGLALVVGVTGSGKSTTLAAIIDQINHSRKVHVLTIEDPIEYVYRDDKSFINQREIGIDTPDFHLALRYALRQDPDVILIGEMRDEETVETAIAAAETGHLVFGTVHASTALQTISRILEFFPKDRQESMRHVLSYTLRAVVCQRLLPGIKKECPRVPAVEVMFVNPVIRKYIHDSEDLKIPDAIRSHGRLGMQDFNMSLYRLVKSGYISEEVAVQRSPSPEQLAMQLKGLVLNADQQAL